MYNRVVLIGNLTRDIELRYTQSGSALAKSAIATTHKYKTQSGEQKEEVCFLDFNIFGRSAEVANQYLKKGSKVLLEGRLVFEQWQAQDGTNRSKHALRVESMKMLDKKSDNQGQQESNSYNGNYNQAPGNNNQNMGNSSQNMQYQHQGQNDYKIPEIDIPDDEIPFSEVTAPIHKAVSFYFQCVSCDTIFDTSKYDLELECDGDIHGLCPVCKCHRIFYEK